MEVKGAAVLPLREYVKKHYPNKYDEWYASLPERSRDILENPFVGAWYPMEDAVTIPTKAIVDKLCDGDMQVTYDLGIFSAEFALTGIYKIFVKMGSPSFIIKKASVIFPSYYKPSAMQTVELKKNSAKVQIIDFQGMNEYIEPGIHGWIHTAMLMTGVKDLSVKVTKSLTRGDDITEFDINWG
ncbi:hypothetical protein KAU32_01695 [bacterium]|nr:hypothetical protein [bacterium]